MAGMGSCRQSCSAAFLLSGVLFYLFYFGPGIRDLQGLAYAPTDDGGRVRLRLAAHCFPCRRIIRAMAAPGAAARLTMPACMLAARVSARGAMTAPMRFLIQRHLSELLTINIRATTSEMPEERIFNAIYRPYIAGSGEVTDEGLQSFAFRSDSPYARNRFFAG